MDDTGERMIPAHHKGHIIYGEHVARYDSVKPILKGKTVLDLASGSGYGSQLLAQTAKYVYGVDISAEAIAYASIHFQAPNVKFLVGNAEQIPLDEGLVDVVVSFETIEHIQDYESFLGEVKRVLKPGGQLLLSTPNADEFAEGNHFHLHEFKLAELRKILQRHFKQVLFYYQDVWLFSAVLSEDHFTTEASLDLEIAKATAAKPDQALYFMVVCSDETLPQLHEVGVVAQPWSAKEDQAARLLSANMKSELDELRPQLVRSHQDYEEAAAKLQQIYASRSWRAITRVRRIIDTLFRPK